MLIVSDDVLKLSQPAVIVLFAPMLMHLLQYILFLSLSINAVWETTSCQFAKGRDHFGPHHRAIVALKFDMAH
jgi:hypothetical protein